MTTKKIEAGILNNYYILLIFGYFLNVFSSFRPGIFILLLNCILIACHCVTVFYCHRVHKSVVLAYAVLEILSIIMFLGQGDSFSVYLNSLIYVVTPMACFSSGNNTLVDEDKFYKSFLIAITANNIFGIPCFYLKPQFFVDFIARTNSFGLEQVLHVAGYGRLITLFGSIETGVLSAIAVLISILLIRKESKKLLLIFSIVVNLSALLLTQQRGALFAFVAFVIALIVQSALKKEGLIKPSLVIFLVVVGGVTFGLLSVYKPVVLDWIVTRIKNPTAAITSRYSYQWDVVVKDTNIFEWIFGKGLGNKGFFVEINDSYHRIFDNMYFNILAEVGILGLCMFVYCIIKCAIKTLNNMALYGICAIAIFVVAVQGLGTTLIYYPQIMAIYWFSVGRYYQVRNSEG